MLRTLEALAFSKVRKAGALILCIHEIEPATFSRWMRIVEAHFRLVTLDTLTDRLRAHEPVSGCVAVTLDDGWYDTCTACGELCEQNHWPVTIYVPTCVLDPLGTLWLAELPDLLEAANGRRVEAVGFALDLRNRTSAQKTIEELKRRLIALPGADALGAVVALQRAAGSGPRTNSPQRFIDEAFIQSHAKSSWVSFGSHSVDHQALANQSEESILAQLRDSSQRLSALTGYKIRHFCYPYGDDANIGSVAPTLVAQYYDSATTMNRGVVTDRSDTSYLPRIPLYSIDHRARLVAKLALAG